MYVKFHRAGESEVVAVCDEELVGKKLVEGGVCIEIKEDFYKGEKVDSEKLLSMVEDVRIVNIVGEKSIKVFLDAGIISKENVRRVKGVPFAMIL